jgi:hypothetical protein
MPERPIDELPEDRRGGLAERLLDDHHRPRVKAKLWSWFGYPDGDHIPWLSLGETRQRAPVRFRARRSRSATSARASSANRLPERG